MSKELNATCAICGGKYDVCHTCKNIKILTPWRTISDTIDCYKIYMIIHNYTNGTVTKENARKMLCDITMPKTVQNHVKKVIDEIMTDKKNKTENKKGIIENNLGNSE